MTHGDCIAALAETARECGLKCPDDLSGIRREVESGACGSLTTARVVLEATAPEIADRLLKKLVAGAERYKREKKLMHCRGLDLEPSAIDCSGMAPVVMDLLLQLIEHPAGEEVEKER